LFVAGIALGALISLSRLAAGAHFFSDVTVSFFVMLIVADVLFFYLVADHAAVRGGRLERGSRLGWLSPPRVEPGINVAASQASRSG
jgi:membrane-associated phospholipid phosphatase